ncbi:MAG: hypothetical protein AAF371_20350 [Pseudomonadota bacterium]
MTSVVRAIALLSVAALLTACGGEKKPIGQGATVVLKPDAMEHPDARFLVDYGGAYYRVNVRYVSLIDESVIAVREGAGKAVEENWRRVSLPANPGFDPATNFQDEEYEAYVIEMAKAVQAVGGICEQGQDVLMATNREGDVRTTYRRNRQVWVVFALCPEQVG